MLFRAAHQGFPKSSARSSGSRFLVAGGDSRVFYSLQPINRAACLTENFPNKTIRGKSFGDQSIRTLKRVKRDRS